MRHALILPLLLLATVLPSCAAPRGGGKITKPSTLNMQTAVLATRSAIEAKGLRIMAEVDHAANASGIADLRPTHLFIFGNPKAGTQLMLQDQEAGMDLPMKMLVWQAENGEVHVSYNDPVWIAGRHGISGLEPLLGKMRGALGAIADAAAGR